MKGTEHKFARPSSVHVCSVFSHACTGGKIYTVSIEDKRTGGEAWPFLLLNLKVRGRSESSSRGFIQLFLFHVLTREARTGGEDHVGSIEEKRNAGLYVPSTEALEGTSTVLPPYGPFAYPCLFLSALVKLVRVGEVWQRVGSRLSKQSGNRCIEYDCNSLL